MNIRGKIAEWEYYTRKKFNWAVDKMMLPKGHGWNYMGESGDAEIKKYRGVYQCFECGQQWCRLDEEKILPCEVGRVLRS